MPLSLVTSSNQGSPLSPPGAGGVSTVPFLHETKNNSGTTASNGSAAHASRRHRRFGFMEEAPQVRRQGRADNEGRYETAGTTAQTSGQVGRAGGRHFPLILPGPAAAQPRSATLLLP